LFTLTIAAALTTQARIPSAGDLPRRFGVSSDGKGLITPT